MGCCDRSRIFFWYSAVALRRRTAACYGGGETNTHLQKSVAMLPAAAAAAEGFPATNFIWLGSGALQLAWRQDKQASRSPRDRQCNEEKRTGQEGRIALEGALAIAGMPGLATVAQWRGALLHWETESTGHELRGCTWEAQGQPKAA
nr:hypothetical protein Iba_chr14bCG10640 [Ipomoea batatas]